MATTADTFCASPISSSPGTASAPCIMIRFHARLDGHLQAERLEGFFCMGFEP
jgi:hypothetical protein